MPLPIDPATLGDDTLAALTDACQIEQTRRSQRGTIPTQVSQLAATFKDAGGEQADLTAAVDDGFD